MGLFGKSFEEKVKAAAEQVSKMGLGVRGLRASVEGQVVTLDGETDSLQIKTRVMQEFNKLVETENTINRIKLLQPPGAAAPAPPTQLPAQAAQTQKMPGVTAEAPPAEPPKAEEQVHVVVPGDTLSALAKRYYGKGSLYMKIFEANKDILKDPNLIKVGQKLKIPKP